MGNIGDAISTTVPAVNDPETQASTDASALLTEFKTRLTGKVTPSEIDVDATLDFASQAAENVKYVELVTQGSKPTPVETFYTKLVSGVAEAFYQDDQGQEVQMTSNGTINGAGSTGDITGAGYGSGGVVINWNSAGTNYQFKSGSGADDYAALTVGSIQLRDGDSHKWTLASNNLSADQTLTLPAAGVSAGLFNVDGSGNVSFLGSGGELSYNLTMTGNWTMEGNYTLDDYTLIKYPAIEQHLPLASFTQGATNDWSFGTAGLTNTSTDVETQSAKLPVHVKTGQRIDSVNCYVVTNSASKTITLTLYSSGSTIATNNFATTGDLTLSAVNHTVLTDKDYWVEIKYNSTGGGGTVTIDYASVNISQQ